MKATICVEFQQIAFRQIPAKDKFDDGVEHMLQKDGHIHSPYCPMVQQILGQLTVRLQSS